MERKTVSAIMLTLLLIGMLTLTFNIQPVKAAVTVTSGWLTFPVTFDGEMTTVEEWSDTTPVDITLLEWHVGPGTVSARVWIKNDDTWLYMLYRVEWLAGDIDPFDGGYIEYFWDWIGEPSPLWAHSDFSFIEFDNATLDLYGWNETRWSDDTEASPPGENNVEGAVTYDGTYYWFEFRKELNSDDGYDWSFTPGQFTETNLLVGVWDDSARDVYEAYISLQLAGSFNPDDDFDDNSIDAQKWIIGISPTANGSIIETNHELQLELTSSSYGDYFSMEVTSKWLAVGDFDIQVDYRLLIWPTDSRIRVGLNAYDPDILPAWKTGGHVERVGSLDALNPGPDHYLTHFQDGVRGILPTDVSEGTLRLIRHGSQISGYYLDETTEDWVQIHTGPSATQPFVVSFGIWGHRDTPDVLVAFDNFSVNRIHAPANKVWLEVSHGYWYHTDEDIVTNVPQPRLHQWLFQIENQKDETGQPMINPGIAVFTDLEFVDFAPWTPSISDGEYKWEFALELPECSSLHAEAREPNHIDYSCPGFSTERSVSPEVLVEPVTIQNLLLTFTLEDNLPSDVNGIGIEIGVPNIIFHGERLVDYTVLSLNNVEDWSTGTEGWHANPSDITVGKTYQFEATLEAVKSPDLEGTPTAKPSILILYVHWDDLGNIGTGSSATANHPEGPAVTVSAEGEYEWYAGISYSRQDFWFRQVVSEVVENPDPPPPYIVRIPATIDIDPDTLNLNSKGRWITAYIELPEGYNVGDIDVDSILLNDTIPVDVEAPITIEDYDSDAVPDLMVKFDRAYVMSLIIGEIEVEEIFTWVTLTITGNLNDGTSFQGSTTIRIIDIARIIAKILRYESYMQRF